MNADAVQQLLESVRRGAVSVDEAMTRLAVLPFESLEFAQVDHHRSVRCGFPEVIFCQGKSAEQVAAIFDKLRAAGGSVLATRADEDQFRAVRATAPQAEYHQVARCITLNRGEIEPGDGTIVLASAGTSDLPVIEEARVTCEVMGQRTHCLYDVGVAGIHRLLAHSGALQKASVAVVAAGMEGALASVVGGLVDCPVIAVPTSVGYGASFQGVAALLAMLNSCASGVAVVNIDNGFGAGYTAALINRRGQLPSG